MSSILESIRKGGEAALAYLKGERFETKSCQPQPVDEIIPSPAWQKKVLPVREERISGGRSGLLDFEDARMAVNENLVQGGDVSASAKDPDHLATETTMEPIISLTAIIDAIHGIDEEISGFLNVRTGRVVMISADVLDAAELDGPPAEEAMVRAAREVLCSDEFRALPDQFDIDDYSIMQSFCQTVDDDALRCGLLRSIQGRGASMRIRHTVREYGMEVAWSGFRKESLRRIAIEWMERNGVTYEA
jgi:hypothetical protein